MKLFPKLAVSISLLLMGAITVLSLSFYWTEERHLRQEARMEQQAILGNLVHIARESFLTNDDLLLVKYTRSVQRWNPALTSASVVDVHGAILAHSEPERIGQQSPGAPASPSETLVLTEPVRLGNRWQATASVAFSQSRLEQALQARLQELKTRVAGVALWSLIFGIVVAFCVALSWTRPIERLALAAEAIGQGRWDVSLGPLDQRRDELGRLSRSFQRMAVQLRELDQMKEDFVSAVTHELRSPLGAIESYLNVIGQELQEGISTASWENYLERLRINTQRLTRFVNDLLDVAALERGKIKLETRPVDLVMIAQDVLGLFALKMKEKDLSYEVIAPDALGPALADSEKIRQVLVNLVSNALKFTPSGGSIRICVERAGAEGEQRVSVMDSGPGIAEIDQAKIFNKFEQVASARKTLQGPKGTGLGLAISKALIELHGQTLNVRSQLGEGSTFFFALPTAHI